jgi:hypothetical protein
MEIIHMAMPQSGLWGNETLTGVPVTLTAIDENNNVIDIGTTITNAYYGTFSYTWTPPNEGKYTLMASFAGDDSYGSSTAAKAINVAPAPSVTPTTTQTTQELVVPDYTMTIIAGVIAILIAIAIVGIVLFRKK